jgi:hypothetical protein
MTKQTTKQINKQCLQNVQLARTARGIGVVDDDALAAS